MSASQCTSRDYPAGVGHLSCLPNGAAPAQANDEVDPPLGFEKSYVFEAGVICTDHPGYNVHLKQFFNGQGICAVCGLNDTHAYTPYGCAGIPVMQQTDSIRCVSNFHRKVERLIPFNLSVERFRYVHIQDSAHRVPLYDTIELSPDGPDRTLP